MPKVWVRSTRYHTYWAIPREEGVFYEADTEQDADTLATLAFAVRDTPPPRASRVDPPEARYPTTEAPTVTTEMAADVTRGTEPRRTRRPDRKTDE
jgi:hypothetical protein